MLAWFLMFNVSYCPCPYPPTNLWYTFYMAIFKFNSYIINHLLLLFSVTISLA
jgi:hypothetical protein